MEVDYSLYKQGKIQAVTGFGKGKTSSAFGTALRAINQDWNILIVQFLKGSETGEVEIMRKNFPHNVDIMRCGVDKIVLPKNIDDNDVEQTKKCWQEMKDSLSYKHYDLLILDEVLCAVDLGLITQTAYFDFLKNKPKQLEVISTGRITNKSLFKRVEEVSDLMTDCVLRKHYMNRVCPSCKHSWEYYMHYCPNCGTELNKATYARKGIEF